MTPLYADLVEHLRQDADFNRSWTDGRRGADLITSAGYIARRLEVAKQRDDWADAITALLAENEKARELLQGLVRWRDAIELCAPELGAVLLSVDQASAFLFPPQKTET